MNGTITEYTLPTPNSQPNGVAAGPDGSIWITEPNADKIAKMPACGLGLSASFSGSTLTANFDIGINRPAVWTVSVGKGRGFTKRIVGMVPPKPVTFKWHNLPNEGKVLVKSRLSDAAGHVYCS